MDHSPPPITARLVIEGARLNFLPTYFGTPRGGLRQMLHGESLVYRWMRRLCNSYTGAYWHYYELSNGGFYMAPKVPGLLRIEVDSNGYSGDMTPDAAGVVASLFALNQVAIEVHAVHEDDADPLIERFHALRAFAREHAEAAAILRATD